MSSWLSAQDLSGPLQVAEPVAHHRLVVLPPLGERIEHEAICDQLLSFVAFGILQLDPLGDSGRIVIDTGE
jgi:hypothetical protein